VVPLVRLWSVPLWKDPSIYHYMAWGIDHGLVPYRDTIDPNWPGVLPLHWLAQALSGAAPWGMRLVDALLSFALLATSAFGLRHFGVQFPVRAAALLTWCALYLSDPNNPFGLTVQRDAIQLPFVAPFWIACMRRGRARASDAALVGVGLAAGLAVWMKPTIGLFVATGYLVAARDRNGLARLVALTGLGMAVACAAMIVFLFGWCDPAGFWTWGVEYAFGPYAEVRHPLGLGVRYVFHQLLFAGSPLPFAMLVLGYVGIRVQGAAVSPERWNVLLESIPWIVATTVAFLLQGKLFAYQTLPIHWTLLMAGALWFGTAFEARRGGALAAVATLFALLALRTTAHPLDDQALAARLAPDVRSGDEIVVVGCLPGLLFDLQVRTPLPEVCSNLVYYFGSEETHAIVGRHLAAAVAEPAVRFVVVETTHPVFHDTSVEMLERWAPPLASLGYERAPELEPSAAFEVYRR
jgi:hypothetical protein